MTGDILQMNSTNVDALWVWGLCFYDADCMEKGVQLFVQALRLAGGHEKAWIACRNVKALKAKKENGNKAFERGNYKLAYELYTEVLGIDPNNIKANAKLNCSQGIVNSKLRKRDDATENGVKAFLRRARCYMDTTIWRSSGGLWQSILDG